MSREERGHTETASSVVNALLAAAIGEERRKRFELRAAIGRAISAHATVRNPRDAKRRERAQR